MNTSAMKIPGSPIGTSSAGGPSSNSKTMYGDGLNVLTPSNGGGMTGGKDISGPSYCVVLKQYETVNTYKC